MKVVVRAKRAQLLVIIMRTAGGFGEWSISGCEESTDSSSGQRVCSCQQLAHFGILFVRYHLEPVVYLTLCIFRI